MSEAEDTAFLTARASIDRGALNRHLQALGITKDSTDEARAQAVAEFRALEPLAVAELRALARRALEAARGPARTGEEKFPAVIWMHGATHTHGGRAFLGSLKDFAERILPARAKVVAPKRDGWVLEPTTNPTGRRTNEETLAVHALFLDCDNTGEWQALLTELDAFGYCYIAYQSGGWSETTPKWRVVVPLATAFDTSDEGKREAWKTIYGHCRVAFGTLAALKSVGFDPATDTPCCPWFLTEKRDVGDPEREIVWRAGHSIDLLALTLALPAIEAAPSVHEEHGRADSITLDPDRFDEIVEALANATAHVPSGRRDIYLALPAVLLDRGIPADDVHAIIEEVSSRYPRQHADKHADNLHCANTTIGKWESEGAGARVTRIGTLQALAPEVAAAIDIVLPDPTTKALMETFEDERAAANTPKIATPIAPAQKPPLPPPKKKRRKQSEIGRKLARVAARLRKDKKPDRQVQGYLLERVVHGESLRPQSMTLDGIDDLVARAFEAIGFHLREESVTWQAVLDEAGATLLAMDYAQSVERVTAAKLAFEKGVLAQRRRRHKKAVKQEAERLQNANAIRGCTL